MNRIYHEPADRFVSGLYRELLGREPEPAGHRHFITLLQTGAGRTRMITDFIQSKEAALVYNGREPDRLRVKSRAAAKLHHLLMMEENPSFVRMCYLELLGREPDPAGFGSHINLLEQGMPRIAMISSLVESQEAGRLLRNTDKLALARRILLDHIYNTLK